MFQRDVINWNVLNKMINLKTCLVFEATKQTFIKKKL